MADNASKGMQDITMSITTGGRLYKVTMGDFSASDEIMFKKTTGEDLMGAFVDGTINTIIIAGALWLFRRKRGEKNLRFQDVANNLTWADMDTLDISDGSEDEDDEYSDSIEVGDAGNSEIESVSPFPVSRQSTG